jgi:diguanylate cyclase
MKYKQGRDESGEIFRVVLQKMAAHPAAFTPFNYAVWYEYVTGINPKLTEAINKQLEAGSLDDGMIENLYAKYVSEFDMLKNMGLREDVLKLLTRISEFTADTNKQASDFGNSLANYSDLLKQQPGSSGLSDLIDSMSGDTEKMRGSMKTLQAELEASEKEVEKLHRELESARSEAMTDVLTGILNRRGFESRAAEILDEEAQSGRELAVLMLDIDHFKKINDTYGHLFGDKVIHAVASIIKLRVKGRDLVARVGGEEFAVLLPDTSVDGAKAVAEQIRASIEQGRIRRSDSQQPIGGFSISIGVSRFAKGDSLNGLMGRADEALYVSKQQGRNRVTVHHTAMNA